MIFIKLTNKKYLFSSMRGIVIYPFCFHATEFSEVKKNHELIHERQILELFIGLFYILYFLEFIIKLIYYRNKVDAYFSISFEREAYRNAYNLDYLKTRKRFSFLKYIKE